MAKTTTIHSSGSNLPWWLDEGEEECPHCSQSYAYSVELRCSNCDAPICPMCVVRAGTNLVCPDCQE